MAERKSKRYRRGAARLRSGSVPRTDRGRGEEIRVIIKGSRRRQNRIATRGAGGSLLGRADGERVFVQPMTERGPFNVAKIADRRRRRHSAWRLVLRVLSVLFGYDTFGLRVDGPKGN